MMNRTLIMYIGFVVACVAVILAFITATSYLQLAVAILLYPVLIFFAYRALPFWKKASPKVEEIPLPATPLNQEDSTIAMRQLGISDIDKRVFLKLIGGAGLVLFLFSIFNKRSEGVFFKNLPGPMLDKVSLQDIAGNKIDPAQKQPTDGYNISEIDDNVIAFYGYTNKDDAWFVMRLDNNNGSFRYCRGDSNFPAFWAKREKLNYDYFHKVF